MDSYRLMKQHLSQEMSAAASIPGSTLGALLLAIAAVLDYQDDRIAELELKLEQPDAIFKELINNK